MIKMSDGAKEVLEWVYCILIAIVLALLVRHFLGTPTIVQQPSMYPTLKPNERLILNRWVKTVNGEIKKGDIITFEAPSKDFVAAFEADLDNPVAEYKNEPKGIFNKFTYYILEVGKRSYIKRVIATAGDHIEIREGKVYLNGEELQEDYLQPDVTTSSLDGPYTDVVVPEGYVFVMGDNRPESTDSRRFGCIPLEKIESKVLIRFWPFDRFGKVE